MDWDAQEMKKRSAELAKVVKFIMGLPDLKVKQSHLEGFGAINFFRGVNYHVAVLRCEEEILKMIPSFVNDKTIT